MALQLLLAHADDHAPVVEESLPPACAAFAPRPLPGPLPPVLRHDGRDPADLATQRWGIVAPQGKEGDELLAWTASLRRAREDAQGAPARIYRVPAAMDEDAATRWIDEVYWDEETPEAHLPRYLLLLGGPESVSFALQSLLAGQTFVGRLGLASEAAYDAYVRKVLASERGPQVASARALFCAVDDGTAATAAAREGLIAPALNEARVRSAEGAFPAQSITDLGAEGRPSPRGFLSRLAEPSPTLLVTASHGLGAPRTGWASVAQQHALQGAVSFGPGPRVAAEDVLGKPFLPQGVWFFHACFSAGVPTISSYQHWLAQLKAQGAFPASLDRIADSLPKPGQPPFLSSLPQTLLGQADGPLAIVGQVDLAWTYAFEDLTASAKRARASRFHGVFRSFAEGGRAGIAHHQLLRFFPKAAVELSTLYDREARTGSPLDPESTLRRAHLWMLRNDLAGQVLLGDPAVRLPVAAEGANAAVARPAAQVASLLGFAPRSDDSSQMSPEKKQEAVRSLERGEDAARVAARLQVSEENLARWVEAYHRAGLAALKKTS